MPHRQKTPPPPPEFERGASPASSNVVPLNSARSQALAAPPTVPAPLPQVPASRSPGWADFGGHTLVLAAPHPLWGPALLQHVAHCGHGTVQAAAVPDAQANHGQHLVEVAIADAASAHATAPVQTQPALRLVSVNGTGLAQLSSVAALGSIHWVLLMASASSLKATAAQARAWLQAAAALNPGMQVAILSNAEASALSVVASQIESETAATSAVPVRWAQVALNDAEQVWQMLRQLMASRAAEVLADLSSVAANNIVLALGPSPADDRLARTLAAIEGVVEAGVLHLGDERLCAACSHAAAGIEPTLTRDSAWLLASRRLQRQLSRDEGVHDWVVAPEAPARLAKIFMPLPQQPDTVLALVVDTAHTTIAAARMALAAAANAVAAHSLPSDRT